MIEIPSSAILMIDIPVLSSPEPEASSEMDDMTPASLSVLTFI
jgi:hypothetical protein